MGRPMGHPAHPAITVLSHGGRPIPQVRKLVYVAALAYVARWAARELASYAGRRWLQPGPPPLESKRQPGLMPGPFDR